MTKTKSTKRALLTSIISLFLCIAMLAGTTFAWFTDEVTSKNNIIKSGNLDITLEYLKDGKWVDVQDKSDILTNTLWEPGATEVAYFRIANAGSLALKYQFGINIISEISGVNAAGNPFKLSDYIYFDVKELATAEEDFAPYATREDAMEIATEETLISAGYTKTSDLMKSGEELYLALVVYMPTSVENEANHNGVNVPQIDLGINILATQTEFEGDSYGADYDNGAAIVLPPVVLPEQAGSALTLTSSKESNVTVTVPAAVLAALDEEVTALSIAASAPIVNTTANTVTFSTVELVDQDGNEVDLSDATAKVTVVLPVGNAFADGTQVEVYHDGSFVTYATVANGKISYEVSHFCEVEVKTAEEVKLEIDENKTLTINTVKEFVAFAADVNAGNTYAGKTVVLGEDLDLAGVTWTPIGFNGKVFNGTFDGNGKVIKNLSVLLAGKTNVGLFGDTQNGEIKNVTVENAKVAGRLNVGVVAGQPYTTKYTNVTVKGHVEVDGMAYVGAVGGKNAYADWTDITVNVDATSYVKANSVENGKAYRTYVGGVVGFNGEGSHTFKNITTNINVIGSTCDIGGAFGIAHYNNKFENVTATGTVTCTGVSDEIGGVIGVWHNENGTTVTLTNCKYEGESNLSVVGAPYNANTTGKLIVDGVEVAASAATLQAQLNAATGDATINLFCDIKGDVTVTQKEGVNVVINGNGYKYDGTIYIHGQARHNGAETLTIKNINFVTEGAKDFISSNETGSVERYAHNVTVQNCTFTGAEGFGSVGMRYRQAFNMSVVNCTGTNLHSLIQATGGNGVTVIGSTLNNCKNGMSFGTAETVTVQNNTINSVGDYGYGIRVDASGAYTATITGNTISADVCVLFRKATGAYTATLTNNNLNADVHAVMTTSADYEAGKDYPAATGALNITVDGAQVVNTADELVAALAASKDVIFANDITMKAATTNGYGKTGIVVNGQTINGNGYTFKVTGAGATWDSAIYIKGGKIENLKITGAMRGVFMGTANADVYLENVSFGTIYTFNSDGGNTNYGVYISNSTMNGWTSHSNVHKEVVYTNCTFTEGSGYKYCRPYGPTKFVNCTFTAGFTVDKSQTSAITFENCTFAE